ncbi:MAG: hypothetical protein HOU81_14240 [Hamadaea sp.]|uniref:hypothetical protein n=1 Tax=Hamadaea sp. TaxID=2024425 RepID=UPI0017C038BE|nr:hypothetical protein [Hamadaea sp.]NUR71975.1 hypothetical protein [Hamadaea sp.]NUT22957.1 hypothetical protein [Hamadaea sp.]
MGCDDDWHYDPPRTFRGQMQRGLGIAAYRARVDPDGPAVVYEGLRRDHRWDWQVDDRSTYLARLVRYLRLDLTPLIEQLRACGPRKHYTEPDPTDDDNQFALALGVLETLARIGNDQAREALRAYVGDGPRWAEVLESVATEWAPEWWDDLSELAAIRLTLRDADEIFADTEPWASWSDRDARLDAILDEARRRTAKGRRLSFSDVSTADLLATLLNPSIERSAKGAILTELRRRDPDPGLLEVASRVRDLDLPFLGSALRRLGVVAVPAAREWAADPAHPLCWTGQRMLAEYGDADDVPALLTALDQFEAEPGWCGFDEITAGLARLLADGAGADRDRLVRTLNRLLRVSPHSYERASYLTSLLRLEPAETARLLPICLLDCEPGVRRIAAQHAPLTDDAVRWLTELAGDPIEEDGVRDAAAARLTSR